MKYKRGRNTSCSHQEGKSEVCQLKAKMLRGKQEEEEEVGQAQDN